MSAGSDGSAASNKDPTPDTGATPDTATPPDPSARRAAALDRVRRRLREVGTTDEEIDRAVADDVLDLLAVDRLLVPAPRRYDQHEVAEFTGVPLETLRRFWRALGFLDVPEGDKSFTDLDIKAVELISMMVKLGIAEVDTAVHLTRVIGSSMARIAEAELARGSLPGADEEDSVLVADEFVSISDSMIPAMAGLLDFVWRRHVQAATRREVFLRSRGLAHGANPWLVVGFADMVGFTILSQHLTEVELANVVQRFEEISHDIVTGYGGRVVKMIGDEVMFVVDDVLSGPRIALGLAEAYSDDELLSDVRVGLGVGGVLVHDGDYYGPTVNLAHRVVNIARPGTVLVSDELHRELLSVAGDEFSFSALRPRLLKDVGRVQLWRCGRSGREPAGTRAQADRRRMLRWDRLGDVLRDLDELREAGERLWSEGRSSIIDVISPDWQPNFRSRAGEPDGGDTERS